MTLAVAVTMYLWGLHESIAKAQTLVFYTIIISSMALIFSVRSKERIWQNASGFFSNKYLNIAVIFSLVLQVVTFLPQTKSFFGVESLDLNEIIAIAISVAVVFGFAEIIRAVFDKKSST